MYVGLFFWYFCLLFLNYEIGLIDKSGWVTGSLGVEVDVGVHRLGTNRVVQ